MCERCDCNEPIQKLSNQAARSLGYGTNRFGAEANTPTAAMKYEPIGQRLSRINEHAKSLRYRAAEIDGRLGGNPPMPEPGAEKDGDHTPISDLLSIIEDTLTATKHSLDSANARL